MFLSSIIETVSIDGHLSATLFLSDRGVLECTMDVPGLDKALLFGFILNPLYDEGFTKTLEGLKLTEEVLDEYN